MDQTMHRGSGRSCGSSACSRCPYVTFYSSPATAAAHLQAAHRAGEILAQPQALSAGTLLFGDLLQPVVAEPAWVHPRTSFTPANALSGTPKIPDTEEATGSNPVSPSSGTHGQAVFQRPGSPTRGPNIRVALPTLLTWAIGKEAVHSRRSPGQDGLQGSLH